MKMLIKRGMIGILLLCGVFVLAACGEKSQEDVVQELDQTVEEMAGYKAEASMAMNTGEQQQMYSIQTWFQQEDFYRVTLSNNEDEKENQIILKNAEGVFVLTPALNKDFRFQTEWPDNSSQPYLFQSLVRDVLADPEATFENTEDAYVFTTKTNYQSNNNLPYQEIHFDKQNYTPKLVKVLDNDRQPLVEVEFSEFVLDPEFGEGDFQKENIMETAAATEASTEPVSSFSVLYPSYTAGAELTEERESETEGGKRVLLDYNGEKNFTIVQEPAEPLGSPQTVNGDIVNLGQSVGALTSNTLEWHAGGVDYTLASDDLTREEMIDVARSVNDQSTK
jgi:outer membrane lipoprotein-sorting protein